MTGAITVMVGQRVGNWEVLPVDPNGKRACCSCACKAVRILSVAALLDGTASPSCGCRQLSREQSDARRREAEEQEQRPEQARWRPGEVSR
jgi:hypothetical protein